MGDIAALAAGPRTRGGDRRRRIVTQFGNELRGIERGGAVGDERMLDQNRAFAGETTLWHNRVSAWRTELVKRFLTTLRLDGDAGAVMGEGMKDTRNPVSGGFAIGLGALLGGLWGVSNGQAIVGLAGGIGIGVVIAVLVWLVDRRR